MKSALTALTVVAALLGAAALVVLMTRAGSDEHAEHFAGGGSRELEALYPAPPFAYPDQTGRTVTLQSLGGKVWVANFIFTRCRTICPLLTAKMAQLQRRLEGVDARFVSFSVDPPFDTPAVLAEYAKKWRPEETRWSLLATDVATLQEVAKGFHVAAMAVDAGPNEDPVIHSGVFLLLDGAGQVRGVYNSEEPEDFARLEGHVRSLVGASAKAPAPAKALDGEALYHELSCAQCHERPELSPSLEGLAGQRRELEHGLTTVADEAYVRQSIIVPEFQRVKGYPLRMPTYAGLLDDAALERLVAWVMARPARAAAGPDDAGVEVDPVCNMQVRTGAGVPRAEHAGKAYWFCAERCRERFVAKPEAYAR